MSFLHRVAGHSLRDRSQPKHPEIGPPRPPPSSAAQSSLHWTLMVPPAGGGPTWGWPRVSHLGLARLDPMRSNPATTRSPTTGPRPGSRVGPRLRRTGRRHVPQLYGPHEGVLNHLCLTRHPEPVCHGETLPGALKPQTT
ncbi:hypothetical protein CHARACLAT_007766 [Characodon lateralis]|uniref:Uncharacterized protein n=1 Tax=Characodon lateralis TaxID=208331 RepID=A0ABU7ERR1_9TELE|nr:hypothetical protein [Characodon lateralis]